MGRPIGIYASSASRRERRWTRRRRLARRAVFHPGALVAFASVTVLGALVAERTVV